MENQTQSSENKTHSRSRSKAEEKQAVGFENEFLGLDSSFRADIIDAQASDAQASTLGDQRFQTAQRQAYAKRIAASQGNRHLQRVIQQQAEETTLPAMLIVEDDADTLQPGQMYKSQFLAQLKEVVCATADEALSGTIYSAVGCPYISKVFGTLPNRPATKIERMLRLFVPEAGQMTTASGFIAPVAARVRAGITSWRETGELPSLPPELMSLGQLAGTGQAGEMVSPKEDHTIQRDSEPGNILSRLGRGRPLESGVRTRMEAGLGQSVGDVTIHTDSYASQLTHEQEARAFTVGNQIVFGSGEYRPGTMVGDAILAHELAHVMQQKRNSHSPMDVQRKSADDLSLENNANRHAIGAVISMWSGASDVIRNAGTLMQSGLHLQRCGSSSSDEAAEMATGAGLGSVITYEGKTLVRIYGDNFYISGKPPPGVFTPKGGTTSVFFVYKKSDPKKMYRLDYDTLKSGPKAGTKGYEHNQKGVAQILKLKVTNHQPAGGWAKAAGTGIKIFKWGGRALFAAGLVAEGVEIYYAEDKARAITKAGGGLAGAAGGAWAGAKGLGAVGAYFGPWGAAIGAGLGGVIGGALGAWGGSETAETVYDLIVEPLEEEEWVLLTEDQVEPTTE